MAAFARKHARARVVGEEGDVEFKCRRDVALSRHCLEKTHGVKAGRLTPLVVDASVQHWHTSTTLLNLQSVREWPQTGRHRDVLCSWGISVSEPVPCAVFVLLFGCDRRTFPSLERRGLQG